VKSAGENKIKFGTDGWRGIIAKDFTFENVSRVAQAIADYHKSTSHWPKGLAVGYDTRFLSSEFATLMAEVLSGNQIPVILSHSDVPTQCISFTVKRRKLAGGVMITASHNPPHFNGIKIKASFGGSAPPEITGQIESCLDIHPVKRMSLKKAYEKKLVQRENFLLPYITTVKSLLNLDLVRKASLRIVYDPMYGVGSGLPQRILSSSNCQITEIHSKYNPGFGGVNPEPIEENLGELKDEVRQRGADLGIATDGDSDRMGLVDNQGRYLSPHQVFSLILLYLIEDRQIKGGIAKTVSLGYQPERIAREYHLPLEEVPVGFKYICDKMLRANVIIGGEESGGYGYRDFVMDRDGLLFSLLFVEMITRKKMLLSKILSQMESRFGQSFFKRVDFKEEGINKEKMMETLSSSPPFSLGGIPLKKLKTIDGIKLILDDGSWLLIRPSGTEPKVRVYAEAPNPHLLGKIIDEGISMARQAIQSSKKTFPEE